MRCGERRSLVEFLRDATNRELTVIVILALPFVLVAWAWLLNATLLSDSWISSILRLVLIFFLIPFFYGQALLLLRNWETEREKQQRHRKTLIARLMERKGGQASLEKLASIDVDTPRHLSEERIQALTRFFPGFFEICQVNSRGEEQGLPGVRLVEDE